MKSKEEIKKIYNRWVFLPVLTGGALVNLAIVVMMINSIIESNTEMAFACVNMIMCIAIGIIIGMKIMLIIIHDDKPDKISGFSDQSKGFVAEDTPIEPSR